MPTFPTPIGISPKRKRNRSNKGGAVPIAPGLSTSLSAGVTVDAALKSLESLQFIPELVPMGFSGASAPSTTATTSGIAKVVTFEQDAPPSVDLTSQVQYAIAVDEELRQAELLLEETMHALESRTLAIKTAEELRIKKEKTKATLREVAIAKAKMAQIEASAVDDLAVAQSKAHQEFEYSRTQLDGLAESLKTQKETQNKRMRKEAEAGVSPAKPGDQKLPSNLNNAIITSAMNVGLTGLLDLGDGLEGVITQNQELLGVPKTKVVPDVVISGIKPVVEALIPVVDQIPSPAIKSVITSTPATVSSAVLPVINPDKFVAGLASVADVDSLTNKARMCDFVAIEAGYTAVEFADCLVSQFKSFSASSQQRVTKVRLASNTVKDQVSNEINLAKITASFCCSTLFQRMMNNPRALASLNCFLAVNRGHFSWVDETSSGHKKPALLPFPPNLVGRDLLSLFQQFIMLINGIDVVFGISLSLLYKTAEEILFLGHPPLLVAKYIDDIRQSVFSNENVSLMWAFQESIFTQSINSLAASMSSPIPRAAVAPVIPAVVPDIPDFISRRRGKGKGRGLPISGQQGNQADFPAETGQFRVPTLRFRNSDPSQKWYACNDFNDPSGCQYPQAVCKYNHICSSCADPSHGLSNHAYFVSKRVAVEPPK